MAQEGEDKGAAGDGFDDGHFEVAGHIGVAGPPFRQKRDESGAVLNMGGAVSADAILRLSREEPFENRIERGAGCSRYMEKNRGGPGDEEGHGNRRRV